MIDDLLRGTEIMTKTPDGEDTKQVLAMIITVVMIYKTDFSQMSSEQIQNYPDKVTDIACNFAELLDQKFKQRGWCP